MKPIPLPEKVEIFAVSSPDFENLTVEIWGDAHLVAMATREPGEELSLLLFPPQEAGVMMVRGADMRRFMDYAVERLGQGQDHDS